jgi:hypothetical protein
MHVLVGSHGEGPRTRVPCDPEAGQDRIQLSHDTRPDLGKPRDAFAALRGNVAQPVQIGHVDCIGRIDDWAVEPLADTAGHPQPIQALGVRRQYLATLPVHPPNVFHDAPNIGGLHAHRVGNSLE